MVKKRHIYKKMINYIIPVFVLAGIFCTIYVPTTTTNITNDTNVVNEQKAATLANGQINTNTTNIVKKSNLDVSQTFAGSIFHELIDSGNNSYYQQQIFDSLLQIENPVTNGSKITKKVECISYKDDEGVLTLTAQVSPYLNAGTISPTFSPKQTIVINGFKKYNAATSVVVNPSHPTNLKPSQIDVSNVNQYITINNLPNSYEKQPKYTYDLTPNDNVGELTVEVSLTTAIVQNVTDGSYYYKDDKNPPTTYTVVVNNLSRQNASIIPTDNQELDASSLNLIADNVDVPQIKDIIDANSSNLPGDFEKQINIFDVVILNKNNNDRTVTFNAKIYNIYDSSGILIVNKSNAITISNVKLVNLKEPINTTISIKKSGDESILAQDIYENKTDKEIIDEYISISNQPNYFNLRIDQRSFNNKKGSLFLDVVMSNYYNLGSVVSGDSNVIKLVIEGFKNVSPSNSIAKTDPKAITPSDVNFVDQSDPNYIGNFVENQNYPDNTSFTYKKLDVNNKIGELLIEVSPSKWYDNEGVLEKESANNANRITLNITNFNLILPTTVTLNEDAITPEKIGNIYASDVQDTDIMNFLTFSSSPTTLKVQIKNKIARNSSSTLLFDIVLTNYYDAKGLLSTIPSSPINFKIEGFKFRGKSHFLQKPEAKNVLPSDVNDSNWQTYISVDNFPSDATFSSIQISPSNKEGTLKFSAIPSKIYNESGDEANNDKQEVFKINLTNMRTMTRTVATSVLKNSTNTSLFNFFPQELNDKIMIENQSAKNVLKDYITFTNPYSNSNNDFDVIYNPTSDPDTGFNSIEGSITFKVILNNYYDKNGNPVLNTPSSPILVTVNGFKKVVPNYVILANVKKDLSLIDPYDLVKKPELINEFITFAEQTDIPPSQYQIPEYEIISVSSSTVNYNDDSLLNQGIVAVEYKINKFFNDKGEFIDVNKGNKNARVDSSNWQTFTFFVGGFKSRIVTTNTDFVLLILIVVAILLLVIIAIICFGILFRKKKYYINENHNRGLINANETTIPIVIKTRDKMLNSRPKLIPLLKEDKPPRPLKQYKPVKQREVKVKPPKQPVLPGQRKREALEAINKFTNESKNKIKNVFDTTKNIPINEPFEVDNKWYFKNEEGKFFVSNEKNEWSETKKPKIKKQKKSKEPQNNI